MAKTACRKCGQTRYSLAPFGYCYLCLSTFGVTVQASLLVLSLNPSLTAAELKKCVGLESASLAQLLWDTVQKLMQGQLVELDDCRIHTPNSVIYRTVTLDAVGAATGTVEINEQEVPVYVVLNTDFREWATSKMEASYLANSRKR